MEAKDLYLRHFTFASAIDKDAKKSITISENSEYLPGHGSIIWAGSVILSFHLLYPSVSLRESFENKKVLDLGSGCGMTAMATALSFPSCSVVATDLPDNVKHLERMLALNHLEDRVSAMALDWNSPEHLSSRMSNQNHNGEAAPKHSFDTIIGCEVVYYEPILLPLLNTIDYHLKPNGGLLYLVSARHRHCYLQLFFELQQRGYEIVRLQTLEVPFVPAEGCFVDPVKVQKELNQMKENPQVYKGEELGEITLTPSEELSVGWFSEGEFLHDMDKLIMVVIRRL